MNYKNENIEIKFKENYLMNNKEVKMKRLFLIISIILIVWVNQNAQAPAIQWSSIIGDDSTFEVGYSVQEIPGEGYIIAGCKGSWYLDVYLIKTDTSGETLWTQTYGGEGEDCAYEVHQTNDGGFIVAACRQIEPGEMNEGGVWALWLLKTDALGDTIWTKTYDTSYDIVYYGDVEDYYRTVSVQQTSDGGYILTGLSQWSDINENDFLLIKTDSQGIIEWRHTYGTNSSEVSTFVQQTSDGGYILSGWTLSSGQAKALVIKTDSAGDSLWSATYEYGQSGRDIPNKIRQTSDGGYIITGEATQIDEYDNSVWLLKTNPQGTEIWEKTFGNGEITGGMDVQDVNDGYIIAGLFDEEQDKGWLLRTNALGDTIWTILLDQNILINGFMCVQKTEDEGYIFVGYHGNDDNLDVRLVKTDSDPTGILDPITLITEFTLSQNYPNPFNPSTSINYNLINSGNVRIEIFNIKGQRVRTLLNHYKDKGLYSVEWFGKDDFGHPVSSGLYLYKLIANGKTLSMKKCLLLK